MSSDGERLIIGVTGGAGHVGVGVVRHALAQGHSVIALDRSETGRIEPQERYTYKQCNATDFDEYKEAVRGCNALIHLAALFGIRDADGKVIDARMQHVIHNDNVAMSYNTLCIAAELGIERVVLASSVNSIGMVFSKKPQFDYLPVDELHAHRPEDAYSVSKQICEIQADSFARKTPSMRIATLRFHYVAKMEEVDKDKLHKKHGAWGDLWGWVSLDAVADACLKALTVPTSQFPLGHETFFICARTIMGQQHSLELFKTKFPAETEIRKEIKGNDALIDCSKAEKMLGWKEVGFPWRL